MAKRYDKKHRLLLDEVREAFLMKKQYQEFNHLKCRAIADGYTDFIFINRFGNVQHQDNMLKITNDTKQFTEENDVLP